MELSLLIVLSLLLGVAVLSNVVWGDRLSRHSASQHKQSAEDRKLILDLMAKNQELSDVDYVAKHLRKYGAGAYLLTANQRIEDDVAAIMQVLNLSREEAIEYLTGKPRKPPSGNEQRDVRADAGHKPA